MQESQYAAQKNILKKRHDFLQSVFTLKQLADDGSFIDMKNILKNIQKHFHRLKLRIITIIMQLMHC